MLLGAGLTGLVLVLVYATPLLGGAWQAGLMQAFHAVCHQLPDRSFHLGGAPLAVCHRCTGIYAGLFAGALLFPLLYRYDDWIWRYTRWLLLASLAPMGVDWTGDVAGLFANTPVSRAGTGAVFGLFVSYLLVRGLAGLFPAAPPATQPEAAVPVLPHP